jgi:FdhE protein
VQRPDAAAHRAPPGERALSLAEERHPEWRPFVGLLRLALAEVAGAGWTVELGLAPERPDGAPVLDGAAIVVDGRGARRWLDALLGAAAESGAGASSADLLAGFCAGRLDPLAVLEAAIRVDDAALAALAAAAGGDADALAAIAQLAAMPVLCAARRRLGGEVPTQWAHGHCPVCGGWPALAETRGLERERRLRCGRCAADWRVPVLSCPFCGEMRHDRLSGLVPEGEEQVRRVDSCLTCKGYVKAITTLTALPDAQVAAEDVGTLHFDLVAIERGFARPEAATHAAAVRLSTPGDRTLAALGERRWLLA